MAKFSMKNVDAVANTLQARLLAEAERSIYSKLPDYAQLIIEDIQGQTRSGKDIVNDRKQPPLKPSTIAARTNAEKYTDTSELYSRKRSNLTFTGQLLDSLLFKIRKKSGSSFEVEISPNNEVRKNYYSPNPRKKERKNISLTNRKLFKYLQDMGREFLGIREKMIERIRTLAAQDLRRNIRKALSNK